MKFKESGKVELKKSTAELKEALKYDIGQKMPQLCHKLMF